MQDAHIVADGRDWTVHGGPTSDSATQTTRRHAPSRALRRDPALESSLCLTNDDTIIEKVRAARPNATNRVPDWLQAYDRELDYSSHHVVAAQADIIVGGLRLVENRRDEMVLREHGAYGVHSLSRRLFPYGIVEVGRGWVTPQARHSGLFGALMRKAAEYCMLQGFRYIALSAGEQLAPLYARIGCRATIDFSVPGEPEMWTLYVCDLSSMQNRELFLAGDIPQLEEGE